MSLIYTREVEGEASWMALLATEHHGEIMLGNGAG